jgi:hypothetical protein
MTGEHHIKASLLDLVHRIADQTGDRPYTPNVYAGVTAYDAKANSWTTLKAYPQARHAFGAAPASLK